MEETNSGLKNKGNVRSQLERNKWNARITKIRKLELKNELLIKKENLNIR